MKYKMRAISGQDNAISDEHQNRMLLFEINIVDLC